MPLSALILIAAVVLVGALFVAAARAAAGRDQPSKQLRWTAIAAAVVIAVVAFDLVAARSGVLGRFDRMPPPVMPFFGIAIVGLAFAVAFSPLGSLLVRQTPLAALVGFHAFRFLAEAVIYRGVHEGIAPVQMSFEGYNFDIVTAITAIVLGQALRSRPVPRGVVLAWNLLGCGFLAVIAFIAITSMPVPFRVFHGEPANEWVTRSPYVLLPGVLVSAALAGHLILFRKLRRATA